MNNQPIYDRIVKVWQRLITCGALAPATALGLLLVQTQAQAQAPKEPQGFIMVKEYHGIGGVDINLLLDNAKYPNAQDWEGVASYFEWPQSGDIEIPPPGNVMDNYGWVMEGYVFPPETGDYIFSTATDDHHQLWLSTDDDPANAIQITQETGWQPVRNYQPISDEATSDPVFLEEGQAYYIKLITKEGGGGDNAAVAWSLPSDDGFEVGVGAEPISGEYLASMFLIPASVAISPTGFQITIMGSVDSVTAKLNGEVVDVSLETGDEESTATYSPGGVFAAGSEVTVEATVKWEGESVVVSGNAVMPSFGLFAASYRIDEEDVDKETPGWLINTTQISTGQGVGSLHGNSWANAEKQIRGEYIDPNTEEPYVNEADYDSFEGWSYYYMLSDVVNFDQDANGVGNFVDDWEIPGIPGWGDSTDGIASEFMTILYLEKGDYHFGVNSDDGFDASTGPNFGDLLSPSLGRFDGGRGAADTTFRVVVEADGYYPLRVSWWEGGGGANCEVFSIVDGEKILIGDPDNEDAIQCYAVGGVPIEESTTDRPSTGRAYVSSISPSESDKLVKRPVVEVKIVNGTVTSVNTASVKLTVDGEAVDAKVSESDGVVKATHELEGIAGGAHTASVAYTESNGIERFTEWSFNLPKVYTPAGDPPAEPIGLISVREYHAVGGTDLGTLFNAAKFPDSPDVSTFVAYFEWPASGDIEVPPAANIRDNYGTHMMGYVYPPETGEYIFALACDDNGQVWLSTDESPANAQLIASQGGWQPIRDYRVETTSSEIFLEAGQVYFIEAFVNEGGGGDNLAVAWSLPEDGPTDVEPGALPISGDYLSPLIPAVPNAVDLKITAQPSAVSTEKNTDVQFSVGLSHKDAGALVFWKLNGQLQGQGSVFTISEVSDELDGAKVQAMVVYNGVQYSDEVALTVTSDKAPPSVVSTDGSRFMNMLSLTFNEDVDEESGGKASNYSVAGLGIDSAELVGRKVTLFTGEQTPGKVYAVNVSGVEDLAGNAFSGDVNIQAYLEATGYLWWDYWGGIGGAHPMEALTDDERYPDNPDSSQLLPFLNTRWATGFHNDANSNYGARASGLLVAPEDGEYRFWLRSDDHGQVWVSMDEDPENVELIAEQTGCCNGFTLDDGGLSGLVELEEGQRYYFEALLKEGGGGDWMNVMWTRPSEWDFDTPPWNDSGISGEHFVNYVPAAGFTGDADVYHLGTQPPASGGGGLTVREFRDIGGARMADLLVHSKWPNSPDFEGVAVYAEWPQSGDININPPGNVRDNYATHMLGFVHPPETDEYQFFVAADDATVLFLSTDETPANKQLIAIEPNWNGVREFEQTRNRWIVDIDSNRQINGSAPIRLEADKAYFIEAITKEGGGGDNLAITWIRAGDDFPFDGDLPIDGEHLSPWVVEVEENTPPTISVLKNDDGTVTITFEGTLQAAPTVNGPWENVDAPSPLTISADQAQQFGRALR